MAADYAQAAARLPTEASVKAMARCSVSLEGPIVESVVRALGLAVARAVARALPLPVAQLLRALKRTL